MTDFEIEQALTLSMPERIRNRLYQFTTEMLKNHELLAFRNIPVTDKKDLVPICLYDILARIPEDSLMPMLQFGEYIASLLTIRNNYSQTMKGKQQAVQAALRSLEQQILLIFNEIAYKLINKDIQPALSKIESLVFPAFEIDGSYLTFIEQSAPNLNPTSVDYDNLSLMLQQTPEHAKALVMGWFLRYFGIRTEDVLIAGNQFDVDFSKLPARLFWVLFEIARIHAPKVQASDYFA